MEAGIFGRFCPGCHSGDPRQLREHYVGTGLPPSLSARAARCLVSWVGGESLPPGWCERVFAACIQPPPSLGWGLLLWIWDCRTAAAILAGGAALGRLRALLRRGLPPNGEC
jgi:hypothetical protein